MAARKQYTDEQKGAALRALTLNDGNVKRTARELAIHPSTIKTWKNEWERNGVKEEILVVAQAEADQFVQDATRARDTALAQWEQKVNDGEVAARDLMTGVGVLTDKINLASNLHKKGGDDKPALDAEALRAIARGVVEGAVSAAQKREAEIQEAEYEIIETPALPSRTSKD